MAAPSCVRMKQEVKQEVKHIVKQASRKGGISETCPWNDNKTSNKRKEEDRRRTCGKIVTQVSSAPSNTSKEVTLDNTMQKWMYIVGHIWPLWIYNKI